MIKNLSEKVTFYCLNRHEVPVPMIERERTDDNKDDFYACPKYMLKDEKHPTGHEVNENSCKNTISFADVGNILLEFNKRIETMGVDALFADFTNYKFDYKQISIRVLKFAEDEIKLGVINKNAIKGQKQ